MKLKPCCSKTEFVVRVSQALAFCALPPGRVADWCDEMARASQAHLRACVRLTNGDATEDDVDVVDRRLASVVGHLQDLIEDESASLTPGSGVAWVVLKHLGRDPRGYTIRLEICGIEVQPPQSE